MNRCLRFLQALFPRALVTCTVIACLGTTAWSGAANAQTSAVGREFPRNTQRGSLVVTAPPEVLVNGKADRLSPGARIHSPQNMLVMSGALVGQKLLVNYTRENTGMVNEVWLLTPEEAALKLQAK
jgi:hypothetical protein